MEMETSIVQVISKDIIKPSSQTPHHLKNHKLSLLDQLLPPAYIPLIFFFEAQELNNSTITHAQISQKLKESLSNTLTTFYPLAGKFDHENFAVDCNDAGVNYVEAIAHARLFDVIQDPTKEQLKQYLPSLDHANDPSTDDHILGLQINFFDCGGFAIGVCLLHYIGDIASLITFISSWAATCHGAKDKLVTIPNFDLASHFPARDLSSQTNFIFLPSLMAPEEEFKTKRFVFDKEKLKSLKSAAATSSSGSSNNDVVKHPTRVELVSCFFWKHFIEIAMLKKTNTGFVATQSVNLRKRTVPPHHLEHIFGNCFMSQAAIIDKGTFVPELQDLVRELRKAMRALDDKYIRKSQSQDHEHGYVNDLDKLYGLISRGEMDFSNFSSWCKFPLYDVDYGWGKPVWIGTTGLSLRNFTILMDTKDGDGIEAWSTTLHDNIESLDSYYKMIFSTAIMDDNAN